MAKTHEDEHRPPLAPVLNSPRNEAVVYGQDVTFDWEPVPGATSYRLEVSDDTSFGSIVYAAETTGETQVRVTDTFGEEGDTLFWRVIAYDGQVESSGDSIESFIAVDADLARQHLDRPDEDLGPGGALMTSAAVSAGREATGSDELTDEEYEEGVEPESVASGQILGLAISIGIAIAIIASILIFWTDSVYTDTRDRAVALSGYPELREVRASDLGKLNQYGVVDDEAGVYSIPIEQAINRLVEEQRAAPAREYSREVQLLPGNPGPYQEFQ